MREEERVANESNTRICEGYEARMMTFFLLDIFLMFNYSNALKSSEITNSVTCFGIQQPDGRVRSISAGTYETHVFYQLGTEMQNVTFSHLKKFLNALDSVPIIS